MANYIYATAYSDDYENSPIRLKLNMDNSIEIGDNQWSTGIKMVRCWFGKNRVITEVYSIWDDGTGRCKGTVYRVITEPSEILAFCDKAGIEPPNFIEAEEA